jgi:hypothetical protein
MRPAEYVKTQCKHCGKKVCLFRCDDGTYVAMRVRIGKDGVELAKHHCTQIRKCRAGAEES